MTTKIVEAEPHETLRIAARRMSEQGIHGRPEHRLRERQRIAREAKSDDS